MKHLLSKKVVREAVKLYCDYCTDGCQYNCGSTCYYDCAVDCQYRVAEIAW